MSAIGLVESGPSRFESSVGRAFKVSAKTGNPFPLSSAYSAVAVVSPVACCKGTAATRLLIKQSGRRN